MSRNSAAGLLRAHVADVATELAAVLSRIPLVSGEVAPIALQVPRITLQLVPAGDHRCRVACGLRASDRVSVVGDLLAVTDDFTLVLPHLVPVGLELPAVVAHLGAGMRGLRREGVGSAEHRDGADEKRFERGQGSGSGWRI